MGPFLKLSTWQQKSKNDNFTLSIHGAARTQKKGKKYNEDGRPKRLYGVTQ